MIGDDTRVFVHAAVRAHDKAVLVDLRKGGQGRDQTDVLTFGRLDGTHSAVMGVVNIADLERRSVAVEAPGAECGQLTLVRELRDRVGLIHKLRKLGRAEKFADYRRNGILIRPEGVTSMGSCVAILSWMSRSRRAIPTRSWF